MIKFDLCGIGVWSEYFANSQQLFTGLETSQWLEATALTPELIPPRERRRAPKFVKMAVEVMSQACRMADMESGRPAIVFASQMSDMETTDYICSVLAQSPAMLSPTRFHNSVHNAAVGYWSIATGSHAASSAIAAFDLSGPVALLEAAAQVQEEQIPVLVVMQDSAPPLPFDFICPGAKSFAAALLLAPPGLQAKTLASCRLGLVTGAVDWPGMPSNLPDGLSTNTSARIIPLLQAMGRASSGVTKLAFPLAGDSSVHLEVVPAEAT
jgi:hypothetical protein